MSTWDTTNSIQDRLGCVQGTTVTEQGVYWYKTDLLFVVHVNYICHSSIVLYMCCIKSNSVEAWLEEEKNLVSIVFLLRMQIQFIITLEKESFDRLCWNERHKLL